MNCCQRHNCVLARQHRQRNTSRRMPGVTSLLFRHPSARHGLFCTYLSRQGLRRKQKVGDQYLQASCKDVQHGQCGISLARLDTTHICPENAAPVCQFFLRDCLNGTQLLDPQAQHLLRSLRLDRHPGSVILVYLFVHTLIRTFLGFGNLHSSQTKGNARPVLLGSCLLKSFLTRCCNRFRYQLSIQRRGQHGHP